MQANKMADTLAHRLVDRVLIAWPLQSAESADLDSTTLGAHHTNVRSALPRPSPWVAHSSRLHKDTPVRQEVRTNAFFNQFGGQKKAPNPPVLISQDYKFAAG